MRPLTRSRGRTTVGVDIGTAFLKVVVLDHSATRPEIVTLGSRPVPRDGKLTGGDLRAALRDILSPTPFRPLVVAAVSGREVTVRRLVLERSRRPQLVEIVRWEADRWMPSELDGDALDDFVFAASPVGGSIRQDPSMAEGDVVAVGAKRDEVTARFRLLSDAGFAPDIIETNSTALHNAVTKSHGSLAQGTSAVMDIGRSHSIMNLVVEGQLAAAEMCGLGAQTAYADPGEAAELAAAELDGLSAHVDQSHTIGKIFLTGGGANSRDFVARLSDCLHTETMLANPFLGARYAPEARFESDPVELAPQFAVAFGLGLRSLEGR